MVSNLWADPREFSHPLHMLQDRSSLLAWMNFSITDNTRMQSSLGHDLQCMALSSAERNPFKQHHGSKKTAISKTTEREFEREIRKMEQLDEDTKKIHKDAKKCIDCQTDFKKNASIMFAAQVKAESKIVHNLYNSALSRENDKLRYISDQWLQCVQQLDTMSQEMNASSTKTVVEPMKLFSTIFPSLQQQVKKREQLLQELNKCQAKVDKYMEREQTGQNKVKLAMSKKALESAKTEFDAQNKTLMTDVPKLYLGRINYFEPSFQALIKSQLKYYTDAHKIYTILSECVTSPEQQVDLCNPFADEEEPDDPQKTKLQQKLAEIRALSITVD
ncbi:hypothetical protein LSH36_156g01024 [Paralvinella palmiformis]|uniref:BAR domain-containing protein n=1 Tax=Paralvinella palmiformis TaxID=53620 RepID=A0AAD9JU32_9ANNE|nr:hypothetical protein LSH36_156g01024 [Paralvinella palmiformis]